MVTPELNRQLRLMVSQANKINQFQRDIYTKINERRLTSILFKIDGNPILIGSKGYIEIPFDGIITGWVLLASRVCSITIDVRRAQPDEFPITTSICGIEVPTLVSAQRSEDMHLTTWNNDISTGDILEFVVTSVYGGVRSVTLNLRFLRK